MPGLRVPGADGGAGRCFIPINMDITSKPVSISAKIAGSIPGRAPETMLSTTWDSFSRFPLLPLAAYFGNLHVVKEIRVSSIYRHIYNIW